MDLAKTDIADDSTLKNIKIKVIPNQGIHAELEYIITIKFQDEESWPLVYIDSEIFDKIKTDRYSQNKGKISHMDIILKNYLIVTFNNIQDFEKGNSFKSNYKEILQID